MNKFSLALAIVIVLPASLAGAATSDPFSPQQIPFEKRADTRLLFDAVDRQQALGDALQSDGAKRYLEYAGAPRLHFGALPENMSLLDPLGPTLNEHNKRFLSSAEFERKLGRAVGIVTLGILRETGSGLAEQHNMAMAMATRPTTTFTSLSLGYALSSSTSLMAMASYGRTDGIGSPDSLLSQISSIRTRAFSMGITRKQLFSADDRVALTFSVPAKVRSGSLEYSGVAPQAAYPDATGVPTLNLHPTATERDLEFSYTRAIGKDASKGRVTGAIMWRQNPGHDANAPPDWLMGVRYSYGF